MFTNVEATPLSGKRFVGRRQGISHQITRQTASLLQGCEAVISKAKGGDPDKGFGIGAVELQIVHRRNIQVCFRSSIFLSKLSLQLFVMETTFTEQDKTTSHAFMMLGFVASQPSPTPHSASLEEKLLSRNAVARQGWWN